MLEPLLETGELPHLAELRNHAAVGILESSIPFYTGPAWASFATGASPAAHGVYDFMMMRDGDTLGPANQSDLRRVTYYELLADAGRASALINLPLDQEASEGVVIVNSWLTTDDRRRLFPIDRAERYSDALRAYKNYPTTFGEPLDRHLADLCSVEASRFALAEELLEHEEWEHFFLLFSATDWLGHAATGLFLRGDSGARAAFLRLYSQLDGYIGSIRERVPDALLVVLSDHGQCEETHVVHVNSVLRELGYARQIRERPSDVHAAVERDVRRTLHVPTALRPLRSNRVLRHAVRAARRMLRGALGIELVTPERGLDVDRVLSRAFTPTVASYAVYTRDCDEHDIDRIRSALAELTLDDGRAAFDGIWTFQELYGRTPTPPAPTLVYAPAVGVRPSVNLRTPAVEHARTPGRGAHQREGILLMAGPGVAPGALEPTSLYDIAPTLLWYMGEPIPADADGRVLFEAFDAETAAARDLRETPDVTRDRGPAVQAESVEVERRLRALGYL